MVANMAFDPTSPGADQSLEGAHGGASATTIGRSLELRSAVGPIPRMEGNC